jgi:hypothetical protein
MIVACDDGGTAAAPSPDAGGKTNPPSRPITDPAPPPDSEDAPAPKITKLEPASVALGSIGPTIVVTGTGFFPRSVIRVDGDDLDTTFQSDTELAATIPTEKVGAVGTLKITVETPSPGGGESDPLDFAIENPPPTLIAISPLSIVAGSADTTLTVVGSTFVKGSKILFGTTALATTFKDDEHLEGLIPKDQLPTSKSVPITVMTPAPGGGTTTKIALIISNPGSAIDSIDPASVLLNAADFTLTVKGSGFVAGSKIVFNGNPLATTAGAAGTLTATVGTSDVSSAGDHSVAVQNPPPGGGLSAAVNLVVNNPAPTTTSVDKTAVAAGTPTLPIVITGTGFAGTATKIMAKIGTAAPVALATQSPSPTQAKATLNATQLAKTGVILLTVKNDAPGGGESTPALKLNVQPGVPKITSVDPASIPIASNDTPVTIKGTGFLATSTVTVNGQSVAATLSGANLAITVPATQLTSLGTLPVVVTNPPDPSVGGGGGSSPPVNITVGCDQSNVNVILSDTTTTTTLDTNFAAAPLLTRWAGDSACPGVLASPVVTKQPARYAVVVNTNPNPVTLSAWAVCDASGAAFLTFYRRATPPPTDSERLACEGFVAKGDPHLSSEASGSVNCPGLTKANGGGIQLNTCEKAVVHIQTFDNTSTTLSAPASIKIKADP